MSDTKEGPALSGSHTAYEAEFLDVDNKWKSIPTEKRVPFEGVPSPVFYGKVNAIVGLMGFEQALAIAYWFMAACSADVTRVSAPKVRIQGYDIRYSVTATRNDVMMVPTQFVAATETVAEDE